MTVVAPGYNRPQIKGRVSDAAETAIAQSCPGSRLSPWRSDLPPSPYWGPAEAILTGHACDEQVRYAGSSGGALTALLLFALENGTRSEERSVGNECVRKCRSRWSRYH